MKTVVLFSGGLDSTVLASMPEDMHLLSFDYGQRHRVELERASAIAAHLRLPHEVVDLRGITHLLGGSSQTDPAIDVPEGHYADASMRATVVPNRNMIMLSVAAARAISLGATEVAYAAHAGDYAIYPDCRPAFVDAMRSALGLCHYDGGIRLVVPFGAVSKAHVVLMGVSLAAPMHLSWSCYKGGAVHCGMCGTCRERREAFELAGVPDPTVYEWMVPA